MNDRKLYARRFGLPVEQVRFYGELSRYEKDRVCYHFGKMFPDHYVYAVKTSGDDIVSKREKI